MIGKEFDLINLRGFWSYVHADDKAEQGRIIQLATDIAEEFRLVTGEEITLFIDRNSIGWGEKWSETINNNLSTAGFFIPVLTPGYFKSSYCRYELQTFTSKATDLGLKDLILPILYADIVGFFDKTSDDQLILLAAELQFRDWRDLRFCERTSEKYRREIAAIVEKLVDANKRADTHVPSVSVEVESSVKKDVGGEQDLIDKMASSAKEFSAVPNIINKITEELKRINVIATEHLGEPKDAYSKRKFSAQLVEPTENIWEYVNTMSEKLYNSDIGFRLLVPYALAQVEKQPEIREHFCGLATKIRSLAITTHELNQYATELIQKLDTFVILSRELRSVIRRLQQGLTNMIALGFLYDDWIDLIDASGIECESVSK